MKISTIVLLIVVALLNSGIVALEEDRQPEMVRLYVDSIPPGAEVYVLTSKDDLLDGDPFDTVDSKFTQMTPAVFDVKPGEYTLYVRAMVSDFKPSTDAFNLVQGYVCAVEAHQRGELGNNGPPSSPFINAMNSVETLSYVDQTKKVAYVGQLVHADCTEGDNRVVVSWWPKSLQGALTFKEMKPLLGNNPNCFAVGPDILELFGENCGYPENVRESIILSLGYCGMAVVSEKMIDPDSGRLQFLDSLFSIGPPIYPKIRRNAHFWEEEEESRP